MIYFIQQGDDGPIKIGYTRGENNLEKRLIQLQNASPIKLELLGATSGDRDAERGIHKMFAEHNIRGEWFAPDESIVDFATNAQAQFMDGDKKSGHGRLKLTCHPEVKDALRERANLLSVSISTICRWGLVFAGYAPIDDVLNFAGDAGILQQHAAARPPIKAANWRNDAQPSEVDDLVIAARAAIDQIIEMDPHWEPENERPTLRRLRAALAAFAEVEQE